MGVVFFYLNRRQLARTALVAMALLVIGVGSYGISRVREAMTTMSQGAKPVYQGNPGRHSVALIFNVDWGEEYLPKILESLDSHQARATFFVTGRWAVLNPQLIHEIARRGHELANHGYSHPHVDNLGKTKNQEEIVRTQEIIKNLTGQQTLLFAPPYGEHKPHVVDAAAELGYRTILWTIDTVDWQEGRTAASVLQKVATNVDNGAIILMHPTAVTVEYLPKLLKELQRQKFDFETVSQVLK